MEKGEPIILLFVEDDPAHAEITLRNLKKSRVCNRIIHIADGQQALDYLLWEGGYSKENAPLPHLILMDLRLPKVDGLEILKIIKSHECLRSIPTVILTTSEAEADISTAYHLYANSYLVKPLDFTKLSSMIESFGFYWMAWNKYTDTHEH